MKQQKEGKEIKTMREIPEVLTLKDLSTYYGFSPNTIMRERWEMKQVKQYKPKLSGGYYYLKTRDKKGNDVTLKINSTGFGFSVPATHQGRKITYRKTLVEDWLDKHTEDLTPEERVNKIA